MPARNLATRTRREYSRDLWDVLNYFEQGEITRLVEVRLRDLEGYLADLDRRGLQGSTRNRKVHTIKTFFKWMVGPGVPHHESGCAAGGATSDQEGAALPVGGGVSTLAAGV